MSERAGGPRVEEISLEDAVVVAPEGLSGPPAKAVAMLVEEVEKRSQIRWPVVHAWPAEAVPAVVVGPASDATAGFAGPHAAFFASMPPSLRSSSEGYHIRVQTGGAAPAVLVKGNHARSVLFGVGRLLRTLRLRRGSIRLPARLEVQTEPRALLRGHQLGYRPKTNSYDGWTLAMWEQYIRDLAIFGTNAIELIPPRSDDDADSPHFPLPPMETMIGMSRIAGEYGLDVWIWYPAMDPDYSDPATVEFALQEWGEVFRQLPRIDAVFVPGGDPGHTPPKYLIALLEKQKAVLRRFHPNAEIWVAPQGFSQEWLDEFVQILTRDQPAWPDGAVYGVVFGPQIRVSLAQLQDVLIGKYPIRHYPDITHSLHCQYPVPDWDLAYALAEGREGINPRPVGQAQIFRTLQEHTIGFITYSEGCNDDVNKIVWSALGWDPNSDVTEVLRDYSRYFIGPEYADAFAQGLLALERNWQGPLLTNEGVYTTLQQFQALERSASPQVRLNWRFQQALYRAYYDAFLRSRLLYETHLEERAMEPLRQAGRTGALAAMAEAERILEEAVLHPVAAEWRARVFELAEALFQSIRMQLSVPRYQAISVGRGANLDTIDAPLNDAAWLKRQFAEIRTRPDEADRLRGIDAILNWTNPGPGGFYDDLGNLTSQPHLVRGPGFEHDPAFLESALVGFSRQPHGRTSWRRHAESLNDAPLRMRYTGLDPQARYRLRVTYAGDAMRWKVRLVAGSGLEVHPFIEKPSPIQPLEFDVPPGAIENGELNLAWCREPGLGGNGRGCQVAEVWLMRAMAEERTTGR
jgi:hypothetical protein